MKFLNFKFKTFHFHPDPRLQILWNMIQLGLLSFPILPAVGLVILALSALGTWKQEYRKIIRRPLTWGFAFLSLLLAILASQAYYPTEAYLGLGNLIPYFIFFTGISALIQTPNQLRRLSWILVITSIPVVILGLGQLFLGWASLGEIQNVLGVAIAPTGNPPGRMSSNFMYANILAAYLIVVFILGLGLLIDNWVAQASRLWMQGSSISGRGTRESPMERLSLCHQSPVPSPQSPITSPQFLFLIVVVMGNAIALILTNSRNGWAIAVFAALAFAVYLGWRWLIAVVAGISSTVLLSAFGPSPIRQWLRTIVPAFFWARLTDEMFPNRPIPFLRSTQWEFAWSLTQQRPLTGWGLRNFSPLYIAKYSTSQMLVWLGHPHSLFLMLTAEIGIPATILFCGLVGWVIVQGFLLLGNWSDTREEKLIFFSYLLAFLGCTFFNTSDVTLFDLRANALGWLVLAGICGVVYHSLINSDGKAAGDAPNSGKSTNRKY